MHNESISLAKLTKPRLQKVLPLPRLHLLLNEKRLHPAIWISGPGGSGKTTLMASYIKNSRLAYLWYQIDEGDADVATFFYYLGLAGKNLTPQKSDLPFLTPEYEMGISIFARRFFEELFNRLPKPGILVFDNYQDIPPDSLLHNVIREALSVIPNDINVFISSRSVPPPVFIKARTNNCLSEINWPDLRLKLEETTELFQFFGGKSFSKEKLKNLHSKTDGWIAGILLLLKRAETEGIDERPFKEFNTQEVFEYLNNEIFEKAAPETQEFMLKNSIFQQITAKIGQNLTGIDNVEQILTRVKQNHWFIYQYPGIERKYQFHPLFRDFLLKKAEQVYTKKQLMALKEAGAQLMEAEGQIEDAIDLYFATDNFSAAIRLILKNAQSMAIQGRFQTLAGWLNKLPEEISQSYPQTLYWLGVSRLPVDQSSARDYFKKALYIFEAQKDNVMMCLSLCGMLDAISYGLGGFEQIDQWLVYLENCSREYDHLPNGEVKSRLTASALLALVLRYPDHPEFKIWTERGMAIIESTAPADIKSQIIMPLLMHRLFIGNLTEGEYFITRYQEIVESGDISPLARITLKDLESFYLWLSGNFAQCRDKVDEALALSSKTGIYILSPIIIAHGIAGALSRGDLKAANEMFEKQSTYAQSSTCMMRESRNTLLSWMAIMEKDLSKAQFMADSAVSVAEETGMPTTAPISLLGQAIAKHLAGKDDKAQKSLEKSFSICQRLESRQIEFACYLTQAEFALNDGNDALLYSALKKAMTIGKERQYINTWLWRTDVMVMLCCKALEAGIEVSYVQDLIRMRKLVPDKPPLEIENWPWTIKIYVLGRFEIVADGKPIKFTQKVQEKPLALLKTIIALGGRDVSIDRIADILWPDAEGDTAHGNFKTTLHRLRRMLGHHQAIYQNSGSITLDQRYFWVDVWMFERSTSLADLTWQSARNEKDLEKAVKLTQRALDLYQGPIFASNEDMAIGLREYLHHRFIRGLEQLAMYWQNRSENEKAIAFYERGLKEDDLVESFYYGIMACSHCLGKRAKALDTYERCKKIMLKTLGIPPSKKIENLKKSILSEKN